MSVTSNVAILNQRISQYVVISKLTPYDALRKQGGKFAYVLRQRLRNIIPAKGLIRKELEARLRSGRGIKVRPRVESAVLARFGVASSVEDRSRGFIRGKKQKFERSIRAGGKRLNLTALLIRAEINVRESGRGFLGQSSSYPRELRGNAEAHSRYGPILSAAGFSLRQDSLKIVWSGEADLQRHTLEGLSKPRQRQIIELSLRDTADDIKQYLDQRIGQDLRKARLN